MKMWMQFSVMPRANLIEYLYRGTTSRVRVADQLSQLFETKSGVRHGCILDPALFCIAIDRILSRCVDSMGTFVGASRFTELDYGEDAAFFTDNIDKWPSILANFDDADALQYNTIVDAPYVTSESEAQMTLTR